MESQKTDRRDTTGGELDVLSHEARHFDREVLRVTGWWWLYLLLGLASIVLGVTALASRIGAVGTLVALLSVFLIYTGLLEIGFAATFRRDTWLGVLAGVASVAAGVVALAWPGITLLVLAVFVGASLIGWGIYRIYLSFTDPLLKPRTVTLVEGIALAALGVLALAWPNVSILVLAVLVGVFFIVFGVFSFVGSLQMLDLHHALEKAEDDVDMTARGGDGTSEIHCHAA